MNIKNINSTYGQYVNSGNPYAGLNKKAFNINGKNNGVKQDSLSFSSYAALLKDNAAAVKEYAADITVGASESRINELRQQIKNGEYNVDAKLVAGSILDRYI